MFIFHKIILHSKLFDRFLFDALSFIKALGLLERHSHLRNAIDFPERSIWEPSEIFLIKKLFQSHFDEYEFSLPLYRSQILNWIQFLKECPLTAS